MPIFSFGQQSQMVQTFNGKQYLLVGNQWKLFDTQTNAYRDIVNDIITIKGQETAGSIVPISNGNSPISYPLDSALSNINIDISGYASGIYTVVLIANGYIVDAATLSIQ